MTAATAAALTDERLEIALNKPRSPKAALIVGAAWTIAMRWSLRLIGFVSTLLMARLLEPADYGVVAMAMLLVGLVQAFLDFGTATAILRKSTVDRDYVDSAWTLRMLEQITIAGIVALGAWPASLYFGEPRVSGVLWTVAGVIAVSSAGNIGSILAQKEMDFSVDFRINIYSKLLSVAVTVVAGYLLRDYRALVLGIACGYLSGLVWGYVLHPYRPRWNTKEIVEIWHTTKWLTFAGMAEFLLRKGDELAASKLGTAQQFGLYHVGSDLGQLPTAEVGPAVLRAFLPVLSSIQDDAERARRAVLKTVSAVNTLTMPIGIIFSALAVPVVHIALGARWADAAPYLACFSIVSLIQVLGRPLGTLLIIRGYTRQQSHVVWGEFIGFIAFSVLLVPAVGLLGLALARICGSLVSLSLSLFLSRRLCQLSAAHFGLVLLRPLGAALAAAAAATVASGCFATAWLQLLAGSAAGGAVYIGLIMGSWVLAGRPEGLESTALDYLRAVLRRTSRGV